MSTLLICTVGGAPQPLVRSLREEPRPEKVLFICSPQSERSVTAPAAPAEPRDSPCSCGRLRHECIDPTGVLALAAAAGADVAEDSYRILTISDPQDLTACLRDMQDQLGPEVESWLAGGNGRRVVVDFTGGTKCMSAALGIAARRWPCVLRYIGGSTRTRGGLGIVERLSELPFHSDNPLAALGYQAAEDAITLCSRMNFGAAAQLLRSALARLSDPRARQGLAALEMLTTFFSLWDRFAHGRARSALHNLHRYHSDLRLYLAETCVDEIDAALDGWKVRLRTLTSGTITRELVEDLLSNAGRRREEERYDDAVGRLYRAIESIAQFRLKSRHGIPRTGCVPPACVPEPLRTEWAASKPSADFFKLGLQEAYRLLEALGDEVGNRFCRSPLAGGKDSPLAARNNSILAHGFSPISPAACSQLWEHSMELAALIGIRREALFRFPVLRRPGG